MPVNMVVNKLTRFGPLPFSLGAGVSVYPNSPDDGPEWKLRMNMTLILPKGR